MSRALTKKIVNLFGKSEILPEYVGSQGTDIFMPESRKEQNILISTMLKKNTSFALQMSQVG